MATWSTQASVRVTLMNDFSFQRSEMDSIVNFRPLCKSAKGICASNASKCLQKLNPPPARAGNTGAFSPQRCSSFLCRRRIYATINCNGRLLSTAGSSRCVRSGSRTRAGRDTPTRGRRLWAHSGGKGGRSRGGRAPRWHCQAERLRLAASPRHKIYSTGLVGGRSICLLCRPHYFHPDAERRRSHSHSVRWDLGLPGCAQVCSTRKGSSSALLSWGLPTERISWQHRGGISSWGRTGAAPCL